MTDVDVLVAHQRRDIRSCGCGWDDLGKSHAEHVAAALASARALRGEVVVRSDLIERAAHCARNMGWPYLAFDLDAATDDQVRS
jgi:hypothetical protein